MADPLTTPRSVAITIAGNALSGLSKLLVSVGAIWALGPERAAVVASTFAAGTTAGTLAGVGFAGALLHFVPQVRHSLGVDAAAQTLRWINFRAIGWGLVLTLMIAVVDGLDPGSRSWLTAPLTLAYGLYLYGKHVPFVERRPGLYLGIEVATFLGIGASVLAAAFTQRSIGLLAGVVCALAIPASLALVGLSRAPVIAPRATIEMQHSVLKYAFWTVLATGVAFAASNLPVSIMAHRATREQLAGAAYLGALTAVVAPLYLLPRAIGMNLVVDISEDLTADRTRSQQVLLSATDVLLAVSLSGLILACLFGPFLVWLVTRQRDSGVEAAFIRLLIGSMLMIVASPVSNLLAGTRRVHLAAASSAFQAVATLVPLASIAGATVQEFALWIAFGGGVKAITTIAAASASFRGVATRGFVAVALVSLAGAPALIAWQSSGRWASITISVCLLLYTVHARPAVLTWATRHSR